MNRRSLLAQVFSFGGVLLVFLIANVPLVSWQNALLLVGVLLISSGSYVKGRMSK